MSRPRTLRRRLGWGFAAVILLAAATVLPLRWNLSAVASSFGELGVLAGHQQTALDVREALTVQRALQAEYAISGDEQLLVTFEETAETAFGSLDEIVAAFPDNDAVTQVAARVEELDVRHDAIVFDQMVPALRAGDRETGLAHLAEAQEVLDELLSVVAELEGVVEAEVGGLATQVQRTVSTATVIVTVALLLLVIGGGLIAAVTSSRVGAVVGALVERMSASVRDLRGFNDGMRARAAGTSEQAGIAAQAADQVAAGISAVASSTDEMRAAVTEIARNASEASRVAGDAVGMAAHARETIARLGDSSAEVGKVTEVITSIAEQTNLLALNATIEAARAGASGKGFAVVANEVKELAQETASSSQEIAKRIAAIQTDSDGAVEAIHQIGEIVDQIAALQATIASAVEQQSATTDEIARSASEAAQAGDHISSSVANVAASAGDASSAVEDVQRAELALSDIAGRLRHLVGDGADRRASDAADRPRPAPESGAPLPA